MDYYCEGKEQMAYVLRSAQLVKTHLSSIRVICKDIQTRVPPKAVAEQSLKQFHTKRQNPNIVGEHQVSLFYTTFGYHFQKLLLALGLTEAQIDRLENSPLWAPFPVNKNEEQTSNQDGEVVKGRSKTRNNSPEKDWEVAVTLRSSPVEKILAAGRREKLISQMAACMKRMDERKFQEFFPMFSKRHDYNNYHRVRLRMVEECINDKLEELEIAPIYFESWTENEGAIIDIKYLVRCAISFSNYSEAEAIGLALRMQYPEDAAGCDCKDGRCTLSCPCIKIRMRRNGKVDVEKQAEAIMEGCGTTCSCNFDCPSRFEERRRKVPLVLLHTAIKGWCVYTPQMISKGTFLGTYTGEIFVVVVVSEEGEVAETSAIDE
ncbi:unnamed protein product [Angiostrongylus costaricensis]|uniref:SET domain-containing protein n=1 Tax=Angiostrongylus costaricensis TaxID=334426 RepID=A0A0R3PZS8_ANGCS|nr:unnamed protein product [Angiostrongylus costaricensis]